MGDIIDSSNKTGKSLMEHFKGLIEVVNLKYKNNILSPLTITLGDEFQGVIKDLASAIDILFYIDRRILGSDMFYNMRYVINYGIIDTPINRQSAHEMLGKGLTDSRFRLNELKKGGNKVLVEGIEESKESKINMAFELYQSFYNDLKEKDRKIAHEFLRGNDYRTVANKFGRDNSSMWRKQKSLKINDYKTSRALIKMIANG